jgi:hypothetical protein
VCERHRHILLSVDRQYRGWGQSSGLHLGDFGLRTALAYPGAVFGAVPLAHLGHWYLWLPYMLPVVIVLAAAGRAVWTERRAQRRTEDDSHDGSKR